ncbi:hypothetical protein BU26DRAFT_556905 [Trematosphaeria pertusa]|uniref:Uncharacterized protein n=1 Tax=Trematosphaeria pertusa TaxID=390896 RepID=A0A6A6HQE2_9PLEO|nr:uncharacterized protein BU26DRAFT_556905 [Trematosphaeria pertusa]KAF2240336.1 hypothetical protein BU26DRAFT_556905 [Trematosphaeria pertusa]
MPKRLDTISLCQCISPIDDLAPSLKPNMDAISKALLHKWLPKYEHPVEDWRLWKDGVEWRGERRLSCGYTGFGTNWKRRNGAKYIFKGWRGRSKFGYPCYGKISHVTKAKPMNLRFSDALSLTMSGHSSCIGSTRPYLSASSPTPLWTADLPNRSGPKEAFPMSSSIDTSNMCLS